jgi:malonate-semialdehyde dehydrogenase (acetylating) / methylmalonate-semialdehyde dehydrogenase
MEPTIEEVFVMQESDTILPVPFKQYGRLKNYINGEWVDSESKKTRDVLNPATNEILAQVPLSTSGEVQKAIKAAKEAFRAWRETPPVTRARYFFALKNLMEEHYEDLSRTLVQEMGKTIAEARGELRRAIEEVEVACGMPALLQGYNAQDITPGIELKAVLEPLGIFFMVPAFNFPAMVPLEYMPYAVGCGNTYIVKPCSDVPISQARIFELIDKAGFPPGVVNLVHGSREVVDVLMESPDTKGLSFVGSTPVGKLLYQKAGEHGKRAQIAAGAKNFLVVMPDADLDRTVAAMLTSFFGCAGQRCLAGAVAVAVGDSYEPLKEKFLEAASRLKVGYGLQEGIQMGPMVSKEHMENVVGYINRGVKEGAKLLLDGRSIKVNGYPGGAFVGPTIFDEVKPEMVIAREEIFGPVACIIRVKDFDEAVELIEASPFGHSGLIFTSSGKWAREFEYRVPCGNIGINVGIAATMAFATLGGVKDSFFGDIHGRRESIQFFTERKIVITRWF